MLTNFSLTDFNLIFRRLYYFISILDADESKNEIPLVQKKEPHVCEIMFKIMQKCRECDIFYEIEMKQEIDTIENVFTTVKNLKILTKSDIENHMNCVKSEELSVADPGSPLTARDWNIEEEEDLGKL